MLRKIQSFMLIFTLTASISLFSPHVSYAASSDFQEPKKISQPRAKIVFSESEPMITIKLHVVPPMLRFQTQSEKTPPPASPDLPLSSDVTAESLAERLALLPPLVLPPPKPPVLRTPDKMRWPVNGKVASGYGQRGKRRFHSGIDIPMPNNTPILAAQDGVILDIGTTKTRGYRGYGNVVLVDHGNGLVTLYAHCTSICVKKGQKVRQGETVGFVGRTGRATANHLHFEVRKDGKAENPISYLEPI